MRNVLSLILAAGLLLYPFATYAADYGSQATQNQQAPPVAQPLVREGDFAIKLAAQLNLGSPTDEATAEEMLANAGVVPANGWISDYPVTPEIIGQLSDSIAGAADAGKLPMGSDEAKKELTKLAGQMDLPLPAGPGTETTPGQPSLSSQTGSTVNNYYYAQGPPVITYYPPPAGYAYLYDWVPYPVVWFGFSFSGFFICHNFTTVVARPFPHHFGRAIVTDHFFDPATRTVVHVDHIFRTDRGVIRPHTTLRSGDGRTFGNVREFRHAHRGTQPGIDNRPVTPGITPRSTPPADRGTMRNRTFAQNSGPGHNFASRFPQRSFNAPMNSPRPNTAPGMQQPMNSPRPNAAPGMQQPMNSPRPNTAPGMQQPMNSPHPNGAARMQQPSLAPMNSGRLNAGPGIQQRSFNGPMNTGRPNIGSAGTTRSFPGGGWHGSGTGGFGRGGGHAGGRR